METKKAKYLIRAEQAHERKLKRYKETMESADFDYYMKNRAKKGLPDVPREELYKKYLKSRQKRHRNGGIIILEPYL